MPIDRTGTSSPSRMSPRPHGTDSNMPDRYTFRDGCSYRDGCFIMRWRSEWLDRGHRYRYMPEWLSAPACVLTQSVWDSLEYA